MRSNVLLPQPEGPRRLRNSPRATVRSTPSSACNPDAKRFATPCTTRIGADAGSELPDNPDKTQGQQYETYQLGRRQSFAKDAPRHEIAKIQLDYSERDLIRDRLQCHRGEPA